MLKADLVIDASGRGALISALFDAFGRENPAVTEIGIDVRYASAMVQFPRDALPGWKVLLTQPHPPSVAVYAVLVPVEDDRWLALIARHGFGPRIGTWDSFLAASHSLVTPTLHNTLRHATPIGGIRHYGLAASYWKHFERLPCLPRGVLPVADALCRFNPIHGQGMSAAAQQARLLREALGRAAAERDPIAAVQAGFMAEVASVLDAPWTLSTSADLAFPETRGERPERFDEARRFEAILFRAVVVDPVVHRAVFEVAQLLRPHCILREPHIIQRIEAVSAEAAAA